MMATSASASVADVKALQRVFLYYKKGDGAHLPSGCTQLELIDEDDLTNWFVQLHYKDENNNDFFVSLRLCFLSSGASSSSSSPSLSSSRQPEETSAAPVVLTTRMPLVFVISPRLVASFIHHGAICSLELMSTLWELNSTNMTLLLLALHATLNPFTSGSRVTVDDAERARARRAAAADGRGSPSPTSLSATAAMTAYSEDEHAYGMAYIRRAHPHLFRSGSAPQPSIAAATAAGSATSQAVETEVNKNGTEPPPVAAPPLFAAPRPLRTSQAVRDAVMTACAEAEASDGDLTHPICFRVDARAVVEEPTSVHATAPHSVFRRGAAALDVYASTNWRPAQLEDGAAVRSSEVALARQRHVNTARQRLCPLWVPSRVQRPDPAANHTHEDGAIAVEQLVRDSSRPPPALTVHMQGDPHKEASPLVSARCGEVALCLQSMDPTVWPSAVGGLATPPVPLSGVPGARHGDETAGTTGTTTAGPAAAGDESLAAEHDVRVVDEFAATHPSHREPCIPDRVVVPVCTIPAGLSLVLTDLYLYGHLRVLGAIELVRCTLVGSLTAEEDGQVALRESHMAVCTDDHLFWSCTPFAHDGLTNSADPTGAPATLRLCGAGGGQAEVQVVFGPWSDLYTHVEVQEGEGGDGIVTSPHHARRGDGDDDDDLDAAHAQARPPPPPPLPLAATSRREGILVLDRAAVELDVGTRVDRLPVLPMPACLLASSEATAQRLSARDVRTGTSGESPAEWLAVVCRWSGALCALPIRAPRVAVLRAFLLVSNHGRLRVLGAHVNPGVAAERSLFAEQDATIDVLNSTVFAGIHSGISIQGCRGHLEGVLIIGTAVRTPVSALIFPPGAAALEDPFGAGATEARCAGLNVELGGLLTARFCVARHVFFGFSVIAHSVAHVDGCHAEDVMNGFTIDASAATLHNCSAVTHHVGVFVLNGAKCVLSDDRRGAFTSRVRHLADTWRYGREAVFARQRRVAEACTESPATSTPEKQQQAREMPSWWAAAEAMTAMYDILPPEQADEAYVEQTSQLFAAHFYRASLRHCVGRIAEDIHDTDTDSPAGVPSQATHTSPLEPDSCQHARDTDAPWEANKDAREGEVAPSDGGGDDGLTYLDSLWTEAVRDRVGSSGLRVLGAFVGGRFGIEVRGAVVEADSLTLLDAVEAGLYAYESSCVTLANTLVWASPLRTNAVRVPVADAQEKLAALQTPPREAGADRDSLSGASGSPSPVRDAPPPPPSTAAAAPTRSCGVKLVAAEGKLRGCLTVHCAFGFAAVRGASLEAEQCMALHGLNGFTVDGSACHLEHCGADTDQVAMFALNKSTARLSGTPHRSGLSSAERPLPRLICGGFPALYAGRLYGVEAQASELMAVGVIVARGNDSGFNLHSSSHVVLQKCLVSLSHEDVQQFVLKRARRSTTEGSHGASRLNSTSPPRQNGAAAVASGGEHTHMQVGRAGDGDAAYHDAVAQVSVLGPSPVRATGRSTGVKVWAATCCQADEVEVRCAVFAYAAMGPDASLDANHCVARHVINGFVIESAHAVLSKCSASCSHVGVSVFSNGRCVLRRGTYTSRRHGVESRGGVIQIQGHVKVYGFELVGVLLRDQAHLSTDRASFLEVKTTRPPPKAATAATGCAEALPSAPGALPCPTTTPPGTGGRHEETCTAQSLHQRLAPEDPAPRGESTLWPVCVSLEHAIAHVHQGDLGGGAACGVRCGAGGQLSLCLTRIAGCTTVGLDITEGGHVQLRGCSVQCLGQCAVVVRYGAELLAGRASDDRTPAVTEAERRACAEQRQACAEARSFRENGEGSRWWRPAVARLSHLVSLPLVRATRGSAPPTLHDTDLVTPHRRRGSPVSQIPAAPRRQRGDGILFPLRGRVTSSMAALLSRCAPDERRPPAAWLGWLDGSSSAGSAAVSTAGPVDGAHRSLESTVLSVVAPPPRAVTHTRDDGVVAPRVVSEDEGSDGEAGGSVQKDNGHLARPHVLLSRLTQWWRKHARSPAAVEPRRGNDVGAVPWSHDLLGASLDALPTFACDVERSGAEPQRQGAIASLWLSRERWRTPAVCVPFSTRVGVRAHDSADVGAVSMPSGGAPEPVPRHGSEGSDRPSAASALPSPPAWSVGFSGAFYVHGVCTLRQLVLQPHVLASDKVDHCRTAPPDEATQTRTLKPGLPPHQPPDGSRRPRSAQSPSRPIATRVHSPLSDRSVDAGIGSPTLSPFAVHVTGVLQMEECVVLYDTCTGSRDSDATAEDVAIIHVTGPRGHVKLEHVHVGRRQGGLQRLARTGLVLEVAHDRPGDGGRQGDLTVRHTPVEEWFTWRPVSVALPKNIASPINVVPRWGDCRLLTLSDGASGYVRDVRPLASHLTTTTAPAPLAKCTSVVMVDKDDVRCTQRSGRTVSGETVPTSWPLPAHDDSDEAGSTLVMTPYSGAIRLAVACEARVLPTSAAVAAAAAPPPVGVTPAKAGACESTPASNATNAACRGDGGAGGGTEEADVTSPATSASSELQGRQPTMLALSWCVVSHVAAIGALARVYMRATVVASGPARVVGEPSAVVSVQGGARLVSWGCLVGNSHTHPHHYQ